MIKFKFHLLLFIVIFTTNAIQSDVIQCEFEFINYFQLNKEFYMCKVSNIQIFNHGAKISIENAIGQNLENKKNEQVEGTNFSNAPNLNLIPTNLERIFPNIILIFINNSNLTQITSDDFKPFPKLKAIYILFNSIEFLCKDFFIHNRELEAISFWENKIRHIEPSTFKNLSSLRILDLRGNVCNFPDWVDDRNAVVNSIRKIEHGECLSEICSINNLIAETLARDRLMEQLKKKINK
ncbi:hypothetical protein PVAND_016515 [Polypedilum vanderplanki]|uniref:Uncharacterized protein n=1 Tax=Polypedilum vanderplanki TaxID=319348 RepID=A0A9J6BFT7_POLVA|nr:hypothetical protein PVAND_016515 [Polypedilum vanderplanki]